MSCFIVNPRTIAKIANYIAVQINSGFNCTHLDVEICKEFKELVCESGLANPEYVYKKLYLLNWQAYNIRYEGRHSENLDQCAFDMRKFAEYDTACNECFESEVNASHFQMLKSIECYLYQCSESEELENSVIYKTVWKIKNALMCFIVHNSELYNAAMWD